MLRAAVPRRIFAGLQRCMRRQRQRLALPHTQMCPFSTEQSDDTDGENQKPPPRPNVHEYEMFEADAEETLVYGHFTGGFSIGGDEVHGSLLLLPRSFFGWNVTHVSQLNVEAFSLLWLHNPLPDLLLIGCGDAVHQLDPELLDALREKGLSVDVMSTVNAAATFNILNTERRNVAAALIALENDESP